MNATGRDNDGVLTHRHSSMKTNSRVPLALESSSDDEDDRELLAQQRRMRAQEDAVYGAGGAGADGGDLLARPEEDYDREDQEPFNLDTYANRPVDEWIGLAGPRHEIKRRFRRFLNHFVDTTYELSLIHI